MNKVESGLASVPENKLPRLVRFKRLAFWITVCFLAIFAILILLKIMLAGGGERIQNLHNFSHSPWLLLFRLSVYFLLWRYWQKVLAVWIQHVSPELVSYSRRPLLVLLISYEVFFASNILQYIM